ncbi:exonuclease SbcCD subunit D [Novosphingobium sp. PC22D]|nr:exonuclease SbcCD subunit D [Novosphingobium sp. PC22D]
MPHAAPTARPFTLIHTSDWHLGHELHGHVRESEHDAFLDWLLDRISAVEADALLVTGDIYDVANPPISAMRRLFGFLQRAVTRFPELEILILGGNHDSAARIDLPAALLGEGRVHFIGALPRREGQPDFARMILPLHDRSGVPAACLAAVPFCRPGDLGGLDLASLYRAVLEEASERAEGLPVVLTGHLHVAGGAVSDLSERRIVVGGEEAQAASLFDARATYVALGHLHRAQDIKADTRVRYAGSPFPLSATERAYRHSISVVTLGPDGCAVEEVAIPRPVEFLSVGPAPLPEVVRALEALSFDPEIPSEFYPFLNIEVSVEGPEPHLTSRVLMTLEGQPVRLLGIRPVRPQSERPGEAGDRSTLDLADLRPDTVFAALHARDYGGAAPPNELASAFAALVVDAGLCEGDD